MAPETRSSDASETRRFGALSAMDTSLHLTLLCSLMAIVIDGLQGNFMPPIIPFSPSTTPQDLQDHLLFSHTTLIASSGSVASSSVSSSSTAVSSASPASNSFGGSISSFADSTTPLLLSPFSAGSTQNDEAMLNSDDLDEAIDLAVFKKTICPVLTKISISPSMAFNVRPYIVVNTFNSILTEVLDSMQDTLRIRGYTLFGKAINACFYSRANANFLCKNLNRVNQACQWVEKAIVSRLQLDSSQSAVHDASLEAGIDSYGGFSSDHSIGTKIGGSTFDSSGRRHSSADLLSYVKASTSNVAVHANVEGVHRASSPSSFAAPSVALILSSSYLEYIVNRFLIELDSKLISAFIVPKSRKRLPHVMKSWLLVGGLLQIDIGDLVNYDDLDEGIFRVTETTCSNSFNGTTPSTLGKCTFPHAMFLQYNSLSGTLLLEIRNFTGLQILNDVQNHLSGRVPGSLPISLKYLELSSNSFWITNMSTLTMLDARKLSKTNKARVPTSSAFNSLKLAAGSRIHPVSHVKGRRPRITYANLCQRVGVVAVEVSGGPTIDLVHGRRDSHICLKEGRLTDVNQGHTRERAHLEKSRFDGPWAEESLNFDNSYFLELLKGVSEGLLKLAIDKGSRVCRYVELYARDEDAFSDTDKLHLSNCLLSALVPQPILEDKDVLLGGSIDTCQLDIVFC